MRMHIDRRMHAPVHTRGCMFVVQVCRGLKVNLREVLSSQKCFCSDSTRTRSLPRRWVDLPEARARHRFGLQAPRTGIGEQPWEAGVFRKGGEKPEGPTS